MKKLLVVFVASVFLCMSCGDDDSGSGGPSGTAPVISNLQCDPSTAAIGEGGGGITMDCSLFFRDQDKDLHRVVFSYLDGCGSAPPLDQNVSLAAGGLETGTIEINDLIIYTDCDPGSYTYQFQAIDRNGNKSNKLTLVFDLDAPNS